MKIHLLLYCVLVAAHVVSFNLSKIFEWCIFQMQFSLIDMHILFLSIFSHWLVSCQNMLLSVITTFAISNTLHTEKYSNAIVRSDLLFARTFNCDIENAYSK